MGKRFTLLFSNEKIQMNLNLSHLGRFAAVAAVVCWSTGNVIVARLGLSGIEIAFWRQSLGVAVYLSLIHISEPTRPY